MFLGIRASLNVKRWQVCWLIPTNIVEKVLTSYKKTVIPIHYFTHFAAIAPGFSAMMILSGNKAMQNHLGKSTE